MMRRTGSREKDATGNGRQNACQRAKKCRATKSCGETGVGWFVTCLAAHCWWRLFSLVPKINKLIAKLNYRV
jgi:hypothetical protein